MAARVASAGRMEMTVDPAASWLLANHPDQAATFPHPDAGRDRDRTSLTESPYYETTPGDRPGTRRNPAWRRNEAVTTHDDALEQTLTRPCTHCAANPIVYTTVGLCRACYTYARRHDGRMRPTDSRTGATGREPNGGMTAAGGRPDPPRRGSERVSRLAHNQESRGATPGPATNLHRNGPLHRDSEQ